MGHRGIIVKVKFVQIKDTMRVVSAAEDYQIKVWDLVLNSMLVGFKGRGRVTAIEFTADGKSMFISANDGSVTVHNCL